MNKTENFVNILKHGKCSSQVYGNCTNAARKHPQACPMPNFRIGQAYHACTCCTTCYNHCVEEAKQANDDSLNNFKEWSSWKNKIKRNIENKIRRWCGST